MHRWCGYDLSAFTCLSDGDDDLSKSCSQIYRSHAYLIALSGTPHSSLGLVFLFRFLFNQKEDQLFSRCSDCGKRAPGSSNYTITRRTAFEQRSLRRVTNLQRRNFEDSVLTRCVVRAEALPYMDILVGEV